jgi:hypothetical protein
MQTNYFLRMLNTELSCCTEDLIDLEKLLETRLSTMEITQYVFRENDALLKREIAGVDEIQRTVALMNGAEYADLDAVVAAVRTIVRTAIVEHELPQAVFPLIDRRVQKVARYVLADAAEPV